MLLVDMKISRPITHSQMVDHISLGKMLRRKKRLCRVVELGCREFSVLVLSSAGNPSSKNRYDQKVRALGPKSQGSVSGTKTKSTCPKVW